jgi:hypothetical protein
MPIPHTTLSLEGIEAHVGNTPLVALRRVTQGISPRVRVLAKAEWFNPSGSVKDRPAINIIRTAQEAGLLQGKRLLDSTSGNMGISYATFGAALGIPVTLAIPESASRERFTILRALGAELILTDGAEGSTARYWLRANWPRPILGAIGTPTNTTTRPTGRPTTNPPVPKSRPRARRVTTSSPGWAPPARSWGSDASCVRLSRA